MVEKANCVTRHSAFIFDRGGQRRISPIIDLSRVHWERTRDDISEGMVRLEAESCAAQAQLIDSIRSKRHELVIFRGNERVWEGPVYRVASHPSFAEIHAKDGLSYLAAQPMTRVWDNSYAVDGVTEVTTRFENIITWELTHSRTMFYPSTIPNAASHVAAWTALGGTATSVAGGWNVTIPAFESSTVSSLPPINILPHLDVRNFPNEARTAAKTLAYQMTVYEHLKGMARTSGIDFTMLGRRLIIWDVSRFIGRLRTMTSADFFAEVIVTEYGADHTQAAYVIGPEGVYGEALNLENLGFYGQWTTMYTAYNEEGTNAPSEGELDSQARRNLSGRSPAPIEVRVPDNSSVILSDTLRINDLIPGVQVPLRATMNAREVSQMQKIDHVSVTETGDEGETVQIMLTPATKPDTDEEV